MPASATVGMSGVVDLLAAGHCQQLKLSSLNQRAHGSVWRHRQLELRAQRPWLDTGLKKRRNRVLRLKPIGWRIVDDRAPATRG